MLCRLCLEDKKLSNSHIIPEFFYKPLYDQKGRLLHLDLNKERQEAYAQTGVKEHLLCSDCETYLSRFERHVSQKIIRKSNEHVFSNNVFSIIPGIDNISFRIFTYSILWRASISKSKFFSNVSLGPHEEKIRIALKSKSISDFQDYGCLLGSIFDKDSLQNQIMIQPTKTRIEDMFAYRFVFGGFVWIFMVSGHYSRRGKIFDSLDEKWQLKNHEF